MRGQAGQMIRALWLWNPAFEGLNPCFTVHLHVRFSIWLGTGDRNKKVLFWRLCLSVTLNSVWKYLNIVELCEPKNYLVLSCPLTEIPTLRAVSQVGHLRLSARKPILVNISDQPAIFKQSRQVSNFKLTWARSAQSELTWSVNVCCASCGVSICFKSLLVLQPRANWLETL